MELSAKVVQRSSTIAADGDAVPTPTDTGSPCEVRKSVSMDVGEAEATRTTLSAFKGFNRRSIRRRSSKRFERPEPTYGQDTESYESIRQRVFQERAVTNAIDALQERWRMLMFIY
ncbi:hypothetical protein MAR_001068 [Mya arenaria]|uniref:Uncharacterized protein n=1 Tax=Mya arenaria TaxID=6604 RepID=A0ABY7FAU8_MYAAR|nr:hypothetical protein MAR_001068 [Mya arenaria]